MTSLTPYLLYSSCEDALEFLHRAFGFEELLRYTGDEGYVNHAEMRIDGVPIFLGNPGRGYRNPRELGQETVGIYGEVDDADVRSGEERVVIPPDFVMDGGPRGPWQIARDRAAAIGIPLRR